MSTDETAEARPRRWRLRGLYPAAVCLLIAAIAFAHLYRLPAVPRGLYFDECSIGLNAALVAAGGRDEHEVFLPVFFESFGNLKNPLYVYATALLFALAGPSDGGLRAVSALFFAAFLAGLWALARRLFPGSRATALYALAAGGFLPWFFTLSRIAFEAITQVPVAVWSLVLAHRVYEDGEQGRPLAAAAGLGLVAGLSLYSYTTARLLTFLFVLSLLAIYRERRYLRRHAAMLAAFAVGCLPYLAFALAHPGALQKRFNRISFLTDPGTSAGAKLAQLARQYLESFTPSFLLLSGDANRRHSTGLTGEIFVTVAVLAAVGLAWMARRALRADRFAGLLLANAIVSPLGMALTEPQHALRGVLLGLYLLVASCYGLALLAETERPRWRRAALLAVALGLALESGHLVLAYFGPYAAASEEAFLSYDFEGLVETAWKGGAREIVVVPRPRVFYALPDFYRQTRRPPPPLRTGPPIAAPGTCLVYFLDDLRIGDGDRYPSQLLGAGHQTLMRCYALPPMKEPG
ncbi:MAG TPA: glycosyltransferase family 39 protein [Thermoanaerobaculia bacterium]